MPSIRNSTLTGDPVAVAVQMTDDPLSIALLAIFVETVLVTAGGRLNVAVQFLAAFMVSDPSVQSASPVQLAKTDPEAGVAVRATTVPLFRVAVHVLPQLIPAGELETVPVPFPAFVTARENV